MWLSSSHSLALASSIRAILPALASRAGRTADSHNGADQSMARDLLATLETGATFPVTPWESMEAGLTVMAEVFGSGSASVLGISDLYAITVTAA